MSCTLTIAGKNFDVADFVSRTGFRPFKMKMKGQPRFESRPEGEKRPYSFMTLLTSKASFDAFDRQLKDTIAYLKRHRHQLSIIGETKKIDVVYLDFGVDYTGNKSAAFPQEIFFPATLLKLAGEMGIGIQLSVYSKDMDKLLTQRYGKRKKA